jgi:chromosome segregation ATPase
VAEHQRLASEIEVSKKEASSLESKLVSLNNQVEDLTSRLVHLRDLEAVDASLKKIGKNPTEAAKTIVKCDWFLRKGLSENTMDALVAEMAKQEFLGLEGLKRIGQLVHQYGDLEKAVKEQTQALDTLETEKRKLTSDRKNLTEKVAALAKRCRVLELRERKSRQDSETVEAGFSGRRTELESKLGTIEQDIKSASARLQDLQSQLLVTEKQLAMRREEVTGINSQKANAQNALASFESRKQSLSQDYQSTVQTVAGLKQDLERLKGERDEFVTEYNKTAKVYMDSIGKLKEELTILRKNKSELDDAIAKCANILEKIQGNYVKDERLLALVSLLTGEESWLKPAQVLEPIVAALEATKKYIERNAREIPGSGALLSSLGSLIDTMAGILRFANR